MANKSDKILTFSIYTLGCKVNYTESNTIIRSLVQAGMKEVPFKEKADICIIHTCAVTQQAEKKSRQAIYRARRISPDAMIIAIGCLSQLYPEKMAKIRGLDLALGNIEKYEILQYLNITKEKKQTTIFRKDRQNINQYNDAYSLGGRTRSFLKIQDGCDYFCTYCTIPYARGKSRNGSIDKIVNQATKIANTGVKEIILTGINIGDFGQSTNESLIDLIRALDNVEKIDRYRISSIEPDLLTEEIIDFVASSRKFAPHFHIPLQSGSDITLKAMHRRYTTAHFKKLIDTINKKVKDACIGIDVIVGFPGETTQNFNETYGFIKNLDISYLHVFSYSERKNTKALTIENKVSPNEKANRSKTLHTLSAAKRNAYYKRFIGARKSILFESKIQDGKIFGFTENYIKTETKSNSQLIGKIIQAELKTINKEGNITVTV